MPTEYYFPAVMNGQMVVRAAFTCRCGKVNCDGCINRANHQRSRDGEQRLIDAANIEAAGSQKLIDVEEKYTINLTHPDDAEPEPKPRAKPKQSEGEPVKAQRTRRVKKGTA